ncbi:hypothetical protein L596_010374 [Steinernema carpocapsae]|uniref:Uncharacterized protein n=1 Tax=Steinernema carpocapsae TaxID=34508 RepID=A0A4U5PIG4_STECR|nr:hypothetical protein L596_010374 [Steinernema carpocapsae]
MSTTSNPALSSLPVDIIYDFWEFHLPDPYFPIYKNMETYSKLNGVWKELCEQVCENTGAWDSVDVDDSNLQSFDANFKRRQLNVKICRNWKRLTGIASDRFFATVKPHFTCIRIYNYTEDAELIRQIRAFLVNQMRGPWLTTLYLSQPNDLGLEEELIAFVKQDKFSYFNCLCNSWEQPLSVEALADIYRNWMNRKSGPFNHEREIHTNLYPSDVNNLVVQLALTTYSSRSILHKREETHKVICDFKQGISARIYDDIVKEKCPVYLYLCHKETTICS